MSSQAVVKSWTGVGEGPQKSQGGHSEATTKTIFEQSQGLQSPLHIRPPAIT